MRRNRLIRCGSLFEPLESRTLLSGVTIIAHGAEFLRTTRPEWTDGMAQAIRNRVGNATAIYVLRLAPSGGNIVQTGFTRIAGPAPTGSANDETVVLLDWAAASGVDIFGLRADYAVTKVAAAALPYLMAAYPSIGLTAPLVEGAIHVMGHSRGAPLASELARLLGQRGIWVDQVTTFDSVPVPPDVAVSLKSNVIFADNYYQRSGDGFLVPNGTAISGAYNVGPLKLGGAYGSLDGQTHGDVHLFYHGTINTAPGASDGAETVVNSWYANNGKTRGLTGFYYSRLGGGAQPASGVGTAFGGTGSRSNVSHAGTQWANLATITLPTYQLFSGELFTATYRYGSFNTAAEITWYLDPDTNPYNGNSIALSGPLNVAATGDKVIKTTTTLPIAAPDGTYYLEGRIANTTGTRYAYSAAITVANPAPVGVIETVGAAITGWAWDRNTPAAAVNVEVRVDGVSFWTGTANLARPDLVKTLGSANHGFTVNLSALSAGIHRIDLYTADTTSGALSLAASRTVNTNRAPLGRLDVFNGTTLSGWALDLDAGAAPCQILYQIDSFAPALATAAVPRADLTLLYGSGDHGYAVDLSQLTAGTHKVKVWAVDTTSAELTLIGKKTVTVGKPAGNATPKGAINTLTPTMITGWAFDGTTKKDSIQVRIDVDGVPGTPVLANVTRPDLKSKLGGVNFGFAIPLTLGPGAHRIDVYALDSTTGTPVLIGRRIVVPTEGIGAGKPVGAFGETAPGLLSGWAWSTALTAGSAWIRPDVDGLAGAARLTDVARPDVDAYVGATGTFGFAENLTYVAPGTHQVKLIHIDPLTLVTTVLGTRAVVTA